MNSNQSYTQVASGSATICSGQYKKEQDAGEDKRDYHLFDQDKYPTRKMTIGKVKYV